jgi:hypothetical protein
MRTSAMSRANWMLFWIGFVAFLVMAITIITQAVPPPTPADVAPLAAVLILGGLFVGIGTLTTFLWEVLSVDSGTAVETAHTAPSPVPSLRAGQTAQQQ